MSTPNIRFKQNNGDKFPDWKEIKIKNLGEFRRGQTYSRNQTTLDKNATFIVRSSNLIDSWFVDFSKNKQFANIKIQNDDLLQLGDVVICTANGSTSLVGKSSIYNGKYAGSISWGAFCSVFRSNKDAPLAKYFFRTHRYRKLINFMKQGGNGALGNLNVREISNTSILFPCTEEQQKIASFFSTLDQKIELNERKLEALEKLKKGVMQKIFKRAIRFKKNGEDFPKWNKVKIQEMGEIRTGTTPKTNQEGVYGGPHYWVTPTDIKSKEIYQTNKTLTDSGLQSGRVIPANSVLVTCIASIGKNAILRRKGSCNQQINAITPNQNFNVDFVYYAITHAEPILHRLAGQGGMEIINKRDFSEVELFVPCLEEQNAIAAFLSSLDRKIQISSERINNLNSLKQGFMQQMFV